MICPRCQCWMLCHDTAKHSNKWRKCFGCGFCKEINEKQEKEDEQKESVSGREGNRAEG